MKSQATFLIIILLAVSLGGCAGDVSDQPTPTSEPTPTPAYPSGTDATGITDVQALRQTHEETLEETDYTLTYRVSVRNDTQQVSKYGYRVNSNVSAEKQSRYIFNATTGDELYWTYVEDELKYENRISYYYVDDYFMGEPFNYFHTQQFDPEIWEEELLTLFFTNAEYTNVILEQQGDVAYRNYTAISTTENSDLSGRIRVRSDGYIQRLQITGTRGNRTIKFTREITTKDAGVKVVEPDWKQRAIREDPDGIGSQSQCGTNDGDPDYDEDNDRDNDGLCDET